MPHLRIKGVHLFVLVASMAVIWLMLVRSRNSEMFAFTREPKIQNVTAWFIQQGLLEKDGKLNQALRSTAVNNTVIIASVDSAFTDMAKNLYESSFKKFGLTNAIFLCSDEGAFQELQKANIPSFWYDNITCGNSASNYNTTTFNLKTFIKIKMVLNGLLLGYRVLLTDVDIVFFKNPLLYLTCEECDIEIQNDTKSLNSGFYMARPTKPAIQLFTATMQQAGLYRSADDQYVLNKIIRTMDEKLRINVLSLNEFPPGSVYFNTDQQNFAADTPCQECVIMHNNWAVGHDYKVYRFKEYLLWHVDDGQYYSDPQRRYLMYDNPLISIDNRLNIERQALSNALSIAYILNRTLILPRFGCDECHKEPCWCHLNQVLYGRRHSNTKIANFRRFTKNIGTSNYREHMFLNHPKVPVAIKNAVLEMPLLIIKSNIPTSSPVSSSHSNIREFTPQNKQEGATVGEITEWFNSKEFQRKPVLKFYHMYNTFSGFGRSPAFADFAKRLTESIPQEKKSIFRRMASIMGF